MVPQYNCSSTGWHLFPRGETVCQVTQGRRQQLFTVQLGSHTIYIHHYCLFTYEGVFTNTRYIFLFVGLGASVISQLHHRHPTLQGLPPNSTGCRGSKKKREMKEKENKEMAEKLLHDCAIKLVIHSKVFINMYISLPCRLRGIQISARNLCTVRRKLFYRLIYLFVLDNRGFWSDDNGDEFVVYADPQGVPCVSSLVRVPHCLIRAHYKMKGIDIKWGNVNTKI